MMEPRVCSSDSLRKMLHFIARDLEIDDPDSAMNPVTLTRLIRTKIENIQSGILVPSATDSSRLDKIERAGIRDTKRLFGKEARVGWLVGDGGEMLAGTIADYRYSTLRQAIDAMKEKL